MEPQQEGPHPEPVTQAAAGAGQKLAELAAIAALLAQVVAQVQARRAMKQADRAALEEADAAADRAGWAPALHREWLADAALPDVARAWGSALACEDTTAAARDALEAAEARLREIHPYAMARYDQLRAAGLDRAAAMRQAAPAFLMDPRPRPAPRDAQAGRYLTAGAAAGPAPAPPDPDAAVVGRLLEIVGGLNDREIAAGRAPLDPAVVEMALAGRTSAPPRLIGRVVEGLRDGSLTVPAAAARPPRRTVAATGPSAADWPRPAADGVAVVVVRRTAWVRPPRPARGARTASRPAKAPRRHR
jgi:hypothetical protein